MRARLLLVLSLIVALLLVPGTARAGGGANVSWDPVPGPGVGPGYHVIGDAVSARAEVHNWGTAWIGDGPFYAYLVPWRAGSEATYPPDGEMLLGRVSVSGSSTAQVASVTFSYRVPDVPAGEYALLVCAYGCPEMFGDFFGEWVRISETAAEARLLQRLDSASDRTWVQLYRLQRGVEQLKKNRATLIELHELESRVIAAEGKLAELEDLQAKAAVAGDAHPWWFGIGAGSMLLALGAWRLFVARRRRRELRELLNDADAPAEIVPFELEPVD
jgi:hypothetical protein